MHKLHFRHLSRRLDHQLNDYSGQRYKEYNNMPVKITRTGKQVKWRYNADMYKVFLHSA